MPADAAENRTKQRLSRALKELLRKKPLDQIRVRELTELCGLRRQSFYYHFKDVYDLFDWSVRQERELLLRRQDEFLTFQGAVWDLLDYTAENRPYYLAFWKHQGHQGLRHILGDAVEGLSAKTMAYYCVRGGAKLEERETQIRLQCGASILLALLEAWICEDLDQSPETISATLEEWAQQAALGAAWERMEQET